MYLKKVELFGFKSFADKTEIIFEPGVTCIVGPNGCGKSNISDSIRWVLGERSAKLLRGSKMEDVIFSGTDFKKPLNLAEVSLTIDNSDHKLPIQYEEVVITRRLHRSGESEYLINKTPCRLKDIQNLILDTGIGSNAYSMIEQGRIDYILNAEPEEKRFLIEEAAGISKYKVKKEEALRKLERTEENLLRLNDITSEVERNIRYAEKQAQRAERYKEQLERLKTIEIQKAFFETGKRDEALNLIAIERQEQETALNILEEQVSEQNTSAHQLEEIVQKLEESFFEHENRRSETRQALTVLESQENFKREKIGFLQSNGEKLSAELESLIKRLEFLNLEFGPKIKEQHELKTAIEQLELEQKRLEQGSEISKGASDVETDNLAYHQAHLFDLARQVAELKNSLSKNHIQMIALKQKQAGLQESQARLLETKHLLNERQIESGGSLSIYEDKLSDSQNRLNQFVKEKEALEGSLKATREEVAEVGSKKSKLQNQLILLEELNELHGPDPKKIVAEYGAQPGIVKTLLDVIEIQPGYELALEAALADSVKGVVAENIETAVQLFDSIKKSGSHRATIFIKDRAVMNGALSRDPEADKHPLIEKRLWDVIQVHEGYKAILGNLIGKFYVIYDITTESINQLSSLAERIKLVSKSGAIFGPEFQITLRNGGYTPERSALARMREVGRLSKEIQEISEQEDNFRKLVQDKESRLECVKEKEANLKEKSTDVQACLERSRGSMVSLKEYLRQIEEELDLIARENKQNEKELGELNVQEQDLSQRLERLQTEETSAQSELDQLKNRKENWERDLANITSKRQILLEKYETLNQSVKFLNQQVNENRERNRILTEEQKTAFDQSEQLTTELETFKEEKDKLNQILVERSVEVERIKRERNDLILKRNQALDHSRETIRELEQMKQKIHEYSLKQMELNHQKSSIAQDLLSRYKISLSNLDPKTHELSEDQLNELDSEIESLGEKLDAFGTVNLLAIDEYQELKSRYEFMLNQKKDLIEARDSLLEAIRKINHTTKKLFEETLAKVRESFREYFRTLFGGGQADLILLDEEHPFESGLDIVARPPGKKLQHITLLSGGEKALTAIALLLSLFAVKPSPFCVLDEVDAPLDEANNDRFLNALKPFLNSTQFIIVTHSRKTIAMGDVLYGVTMQEPGVSKLVSVRLSKETDKIEHADQGVASELNQVLN
ncbi:MAG: chromosome segregation protein SMC [Candidatus Omnitrophica bacterium]|nr:chromosome segregation protein SMC [Candidatus Omnitrophota bacterium]